MGVPHAAQAGAAGELWVLGEALVDEFHDGAVPGGAPFNLARSLAALGLAPRFITRDEVPADEVAAEREILLKRPDLDGKPDNVKEKIVDGILSKNFFGQSVLLDQQWIHDTGKTVGQALKEGGFELLGFQRFAVSE